MMAIRGEMDPKVLLLVSDVPGGGNSPLQKREMLKKQTSSGTF